MIKAIFFDIDGTLLSKKNPRITKELKETFTILREKGILLFIATGRHSLEIQDLKLNEDYSFDAYVTLNGCYCYNKKEIIHRAIISKKDVQKVIEVVEASDMACMFVESDRLYINKITERVKIAQEAIHSPLPQVRDIKQALDNDIFQIIPYISEEEIPLLLEVTNHCKGTRWHPLAYDIIPASGGKEEGIKKILECYDIKQEETMAFGDGHNDIEMLKMVSIGVAMGNAEEMLKQHSDYITLSVDENGIQHALKHFNIL